MKTLSLIAIVSLATGISTFADGTNAMTGSSSALPDEKSRVSYAIGMMLGHNWQQQGLDVDPMIAAQGIKDVQTGGTTLLTQDEMKQTLTAFQQEFAAKRKQKQAEQAIKNKADGEAFLAANKSKPGVVALPDGLQYVVLTNGDGAIPAPTDTVSVNYRGTLIDGTEFDSSYKRGKPAEFPVGGVIHGWTEALEMMKVGSKWRLFVPAELAYGPQGRPGIPPNAVLIFDVELLSVKAPPAAAATPPNPPLTSDIIKVPSAAEMKNGAKIEVIKPEDVQKAQQQQ